MSVRVMTDVWAIDLPDSQKIVLLALADCANDEGHCWPSMATLSKKCSKGERTVQGVIKELVKAGHLTRKEVLGKGCNYYVHPRRDCAPAENTPPQGTAKTPAASADKPLRTVIVDKAKALPTARPKPEKPKWDLPSWIPADAWEGFEEMRKAIRKPMTDRARNMIVCELEKLRGPPGHILDQSTRNNWQDVYELKDKSNGQHGNQNDGMGRTERAAERLKQQLSGGAGRTEQGAAGFAALPSGQGNRIIDAEPSPMRAIGHVGQ